MQWLNYSSGWLVCKKGCGLLVVVVSLLLVAVIFQFKNIFDINYSLPFVFLFNRFSDLPVLDILQPKFHDSIHGFTDNCQQDVIQKQRSINDCSDDGPVFHINAFHIETFRATLTLFTVASFLVTRNLHVTARILGTESISRSFGQLPLSPEKSMQQVSTLRTPTWEWREKRVSRCAFIGHSRLATRKLFSVSTRNSSFYRDDTCFAPTMPVPKLDVNTRRVKIV